MSALFSSAGERVRCGVVPVYLEYRECLEQAQMSALFLRCARIISDSRATLYEDAQNLNRTVVAQLACQ